MSRDGYWAREGAIEGDGEGGYLIIVNYNRDGF